MYRILQMIQPNITLVFRDASKLEATLINATDFDLECGLLRSYDAAAVKIKVYYSHGVIVAIFLIFNL